MINENKRNRTKRKLEDAFIRVYARKDYPSITISDVCAEAGVYRSTFYNHYRHMGELLASIEDRVIDSLMDSAVNFAKFRVEIIYKSPKYLMKQYEAILQTLHDNREILLVFFSRSACPSFVEKYKKAIKCSLQGAFVSNAIDTGSEINDIVLDYAVSGIINAQYTWLKNDTMSVEGMAVLLGKLNNSILKLIV